MVGWHHWLNGHEFEQSLGDDEGQGSLVCCSPWGCRVWHSFSDWTTATKPGDIWLSAGTSLRLVPASQRVEPETSWPQPWPHLGELLEQYCLLSLFSCWGVSDSFVTPWTIAHQAPLSMGFLGQEYWSGLPFPSPGTLPHPEIEPVSLALTGRFFTTEPPGKPRTMLSLGQDSPLALSPL